MDLIMFYDTDHGATINSRPDNGWWHENPNGTNPPPDGKSYRATTSLLGKYDCTDYNTQKQHFYWMAALGCSGVASDFTNVRSLREKSNEIDSDHYKFFVGVHNTLITQLKVISETTEFKLPKVYPVLRLNDEEYDNLRLMLDDMYELYKQYPNSWYKFDDGTINKDKPFITVFANWNLLSSWKSSRIPVEDDRFNIRWSNGFFIGGTTVPEPSQNGYLKINKDTPYWLFVEHDEQKEGYYTPIYKEGQDGSVEQMQTWVSIWKDGTNWDGMLNKIDGKYPIERYSEPIEKLNPKAVLINRFNYPLIWLDEPQEGVSIENSSHIEPNVDWGFKMFNIVSKQLYKMKGLKMTAPDIEKAIKTDKGQIKIDLSNYPLEYTVSNDPDFLDCNWEFVDTSNNCLKIENLDTSKAIYVKIRNSFGESAIKQIEAERV